MQFFFRHRVFEPSIELLNLFPCLFLTTGQKKGVEDNQAHIVPRLVSDFIVADGPEPNHLTNAEKR